MGWQFDSPHSPVLPCSCNVVGTRATLDVFSSEHPEQLPPQTLPERVTSTRSAGTRFSASTTTFSSSANGHGSRGRSTWRPRVTAATRVPPAVCTYLRTYVRCARVRIKLPRSVLHRCKYHSTHSIIGVHQTHELETIKLCVSHALNSSRT